MVQQQFLNREDELGTVKTAFQSEMAELLVIYGRRRFGKSALFVKQRPMSATPSWQATEETSDVQLADFVATASETFRSRQT